MHEKPLRILHTWLKANGYSIRYSQLESEFASHPDAGSLIAIIDTLNGFNIPNQAILIEPEDIEKLEGPFIAYLQYKAIGQFVLLTPLPNQTFEVNTGEQNTFVYGIQEIMKVFTGIIIFMEPNEKWVVEISHNFKMVCYLLLVLLVAIGLYFGFVPFMQH